MTPLIVIALYLAVTFSIGTLAWWRGRVTADDYYIFFYPQIAQIFTDFYSVLKVIPAFMPSARE